MKSGQPEPENRTRKRAIVWLSAAGLAIVITFLLFPPWTLRTVSETQSEEIEQVQLSSPALSPDGKRAILTYRRKGRPSGLALWEIESDRLILIPHPPGRHVTEASFSPDGSTLVATSYCFGVGRCDDEWDQVDLVLIDLSTFRHTTIDNRPGYKGRPVFDSTGRRIAFVHARIDRLKFGEDIRRDIGINGISARYQDGRVEVLLQDDLTSGFLFIDRPSFIANDQLIFPAIAPMSKDAKQELKALDKQYESLGYQLSISSTIATPELRLLELNHDPTRKGLTSLSASADGQRMVFIDLSETNRSKRGFLPWELFLIENGTVRQLTNLNTHFHTATISADGTRVAFLADATRQKSFDLFALDIDNGMLHAPNLRARLQEILERRDREAQAERQT